MGRTRVLSLAVIGCLSLCSVRSSADLRIDGDRLYVATANIRVVFQGGEIREITNRVTGERFASGLQRHTPLTSMLTATGEAVPLRCDGWRRGHENIEGREAAQTVLRSTKFTVWFNVVLDKETDDVTVGTWGESSGDGVMGCRWAVRSLDLSVGSLLVPTASRFQYDSSDSRQEVRLAYPSQWLAQMLVWQGRQGGIVLYSRDDENRYKGLHLIRRGQYLDIALETRAAGPWQDATSVPYVEWRVNAYRGDWRVPANGYRKLMAFLRPRKTPPESRLWAGQITRVWMVPDGAGDSWLGDIAKTSPPARTLLVLDNWSEGKPPEYRLTYRATTFIDRAHARGFYVMVPACIQHASQEWLSSARMSGCSHPEPDASGLFWVNPAASAWRSAVVRAYRQAFSGTRPDALLLWDAAGVVTEADKASNRSGLEGVLRLFEELQAALPDVVLGAEGIHELILPHVRFVRRPAGSSSGNNALTEHLFGDSVLWLDRLAEPTSGSP